jgi:hypothetical protein
MIKNSDAAQELFDSLCDEYEDCDIWSFLTEELDAVTIEGSERVNHLFEQIEYSENWTYFWNGDVYIMFPFTETETINRLNEAEMRLVSDEKEPDLANMTLLERLNAGYERGQQ